MGMYPNMMGMNPNNINLNADSSYPQGNNDFNSMNMGNMNYQGFNPAMFQGQNFPQNMHNMDMQMNNQEHDQDQDQEDDD